MREVRAAVLKTRRVLLWRNHVGTGYSTSGGAFVSFGLGKGSADLVGLLVGSGRFFALEVKTPIGRIRPNQRAWAAAIQRAGGFVAFVRSTAEALDALTRAETGMRG